MSFRRTFFWAALTVALVSLAFAQGCTGFFVNQPTSLTVTTGADGGGSSTFTVNEGQTINLFATATFQDGSGNKDITSTASWQSSTPCATVTRGTVKGIGPATGVTITASLNGVAGSASGSVTGNGQGLVISSSPAGPNFTNLSMATFTATLNGQDVTASTTWTSSSNIATFAGNVATFSGTGSATVTASFVSGNSCNGASDNITVQ
jgi:hypothetical protein